MSEHDDRPVSRTWTGQMPPPVALPKSVDVVIIGGGIVGVSTAYFLAKNGVSVALCEKGYIAGEQSGRNWGWVRVQGRDPREIPMMLDSMNIWRGLAEEIGEDVGYAEHGCLFTARTQKELDALKGWLPVAEEYGIRTSVLDAGQLKSHVGESAASQWYGALYTASDGRAEPHRAAPAIARAATRSGAKIITGCAVRGLLVEGGRVTGVVTERREIRCQRVLCAAGAWTSLFCGANGIKLPQLRCRGTVARLAPAGSALNGNLFDDKIGIRRRQDGGYTVAHGSILDHGITPSTFRWAFKFLPALKQEFASLRVRIGQEFIDGMMTPSNWALDQPSPFEKVRVLDPKPNASVLKKMQRNLGKVFPELGHVPIVEAWAGMVETSPDVVPVIGEEESLPGFFVATGFSGHGFGLGPGAGRSIAALLAGDEPPVDLSAFRRERFFDGSPIRPYSVI